MAGCWIGQQSLTPRPSTVCDREWSRPPLMGTPTALSPGRRLLRAAPRPRPPPLADPCFTGPDRLASSGHFRSFFPCCCSFCEALIFLRGILGRREYARFWLVTLVLVPNSVYRFTVPKRWVRNPSWGYWAIPLRSRRPVNFCFKC